MFLNFDFFKKKETKNYFLNILNHNNSLEVSTIWKIKVHYIYVFRIYNYNVIAIYEQIQITC